MGMGQLSDGARPLSRKSKKKFAWSPGRGRRDNHAPQGRASLEVKRRIEAVLTKVAQPTVVPDRLQAERAQKVLGWAGTHKARQVLEELATQGRNRWLKEAAAESLRCVKRSASVP
jgi:hypothetical protein